MNTARKLGLPGLLLASALALASCGGSGGGQGEDMQGMDQGGGSGGDTQASEQAARETTGSGETSGTGGTTGGMQPMEGMDHDSSSPEEMARQLVAPNGEYSDAAFVDAMIPHHEGAVEMAEVALENAEHEEIRTLSEEIVRTQRAEIGLLEGMREELGGATTTSMSQEGMMGMSEEPQALAGARPFDRAFIDAMTPHHESAIAMANVALEESRDPEIRGIAEDIISAQEREIQQMRQWREEWYPEG